MVHSDKRIEYIQGPVQKRSTVQNVKVSRARAFKIALQKFIIFRFSGNKFDIILELHEDFSMETFLKARPSAQMISLSQFELFRRRQIDIFEDKTYFTDWPYLLSASGQGITLSSRNLGNAKEKNFDYHKKLNLWGKIYHRDFTPICKTCSCNTCKNYSRSYIHHLLGVHEISASILLAEHNTHQFKKMLEEVHVNRTHGTE